MQGREFIKNVYKKSALVLLPLALISAFIEPRKLPAGIIAGGLLGLVNLRGLAWGIEGLLGSQKATGGMIFFSMFRLLMLFVMLSILLYLRLVNILGVLAGFTVIFTVLIIEGLKYAKNRDDSSPDN